MIVIWELFSQEPRLKMLTLTGIKDLRLSAYEIPGFSKVDIADEIINLDATRKAFQANLNSVKTEEEMPGSFFESLGDG